MQKLLDMYILMIKIGVMLYFSKTTHSTMYGKIFLMKNTKISSKIIIAKPVKMDHLMENGVYFQAIVQAVVNF